MNHLILRHIRIHAIVIVFVILTFSTTIFAQHYKEIFLSNGEHVRIDKSNYGFSAVMMENGKVVSVQKDNPEEVVRVIVTFKEQPLTVYQHKKSSLQKSSLSSAYAAMQDRHISFRTALNTIRQQLSVQRKSDYNYTIKRDYYRALNGMALECKRGMINRIRTLPIVKHISLDREVKANLTQSVHQIRADIVQDSLGYTGKDVLVGIIDTGIDYNNPALGGGFGPAFRVIGGYDFANNDNDPLDDEVELSAHIAGNNRYNTVFGFQ